MTVRLGPTPGQVLNAFVWAGVSVLLGIGFLVIASIEPATFAGQVIGLVLIGLGATSIILEWRALPGARFDFGDNTLTITSTAGGRVEIDYDHIRALRLETVPVTRRGHRRMPTTEGRRPGEWVFVDENPEAVLLKGFRVGVSLSSVESLKAACRTHGITVESGF